MTWKIEAFLTTRLLPRVIYRDDGGRRMRLASSYARGDILDPGCAQKPNALLVGRVTESDVVPPRQALPPNYTEFVECGVARLEQTFAPSSFDTVEALEVIERLPDHCQFMSSVARLLRRGGTLVLSAPNPYYWATLAANVGFSRGLSASGAGSEGCSSGRATFGPYHGHIHLHALRLLNLIALERGLVLETILASRGWNAPLLATNLLYVYRSLPGHGST